MSNRRRLARERLEIYLVHLLLAYRPLIFFVAFLMLAYSLLSLFYNPVVGFASLLPAVFLLLLSNSYPVTVYTARMGAWIATLCRHED